MTCDRHVSPSRDTTCQLEKRVPAHNHKPDSSSTGCCHLSLHPTDRRMGRRFPEADSGPASARFIQCTTDRPVMAGVTLNRRGINDDLFSQFTNINQSSANARGSPQSLIVVFSSPGRRPPSWSDRHPGRRQQGFLQD